VLDFIKSELESFSLKLTSNQNGREGVDFLIEKKQLYLHSIDLDTSQRSFKILKQDLGELKDNLFVALVFYLIPSKDLLQANSSIFIENNVNLNPSLSNWEIKVSSNSISELAKYALENIIDKLKV
jgi:hypothetical protein